MKLEITDRIDKQDEDTIYQGLLEFNLACLEDKEPKELGLYIRNAAGQVVAGLIGGTHGLWLTVKYLWISDDLRKQGIGSHILSKAEETAKQRGCKYTFLDSFSFQAPEFYKKHGYKEVFILENYPITGKRYYFIKIL